MPIISTRKIEDFIIAPTMHAEPVPLSTVSVLSPGFIRLPQKECTPIDCWAEECEKHFQAQLEETENAYIVETTDFTVEPTDEVSWEVATHSSNNNSDAVETHVTAVFRHNPYDMRTSKHFEFQCAVDSCDPFAAAAPQPEGHSCAFPAPSEQHYVQQQGASAGYQQQQPVSSWNVQPSNERNQENSFPQVEVARQQMVPEEPMKFVPPPPPPVAAYEIFLDEYDSIYKDEIDTSDEQQVEEKKQRCRSYGLHLQYRSAMRWFERLERCQLQWVSKDDPCPAPTAEVADSPVSFLEWNRAAYQWWMRWFEHAQKKCSPLGIGSMKRSNRSNTGAFATHRGELSSAKSHKWGHGNDESGLEFRSSGSSVKTTFRAQRAAVFASLQQAEMSGSRRPLSYKSTGHE